MTARERAVEIAGREVDSPGLGSFVIEALEADGLTVVERDDLHSVGLVREAFGRYYRHGIGQNAVDEEHDARELLVALHGTGAAVDPEPREHVDARGVVWRRESGGCWHRPETTEHVGECEERCPSTLASIQRTYGTREGS